MAVTSTQTRLNSYRRKKAVFRKNESFLWRRSCISFRICVKMLTKLLRTNNNFSTYFFSFLNVRLPFYLSVVRWIVCQCSFACTFIPSLCFMPFIFVSFHFSCWHCPNIAILSAFFFAQHSRVLFNFSTDDVSFCHKTPNLFCRLCFYKQTLIIIM